MGSSRTPTRRSGFTLIDRVRVVPPAKPLRKAELDRRFQSFETSGLEFNATSEPGQVTLQLKKGRR